MRLRGMCVVVVTALAAGCASAGTEGGADAELTIPSTAGRASQSTAQVMAPVTSTPITSTPSTNPLVTSTPLTSTPLTSTPPTTGAAAVTGAVGPDVGDPYHPTLGNTGVDALHYDLDLVYDPVTSVMEGVAGIDLRAEIDLAAFDLDLVGLPVEMVTVDGEAASFTMTPDEIRVDLPEPVVAGTPLRVEVAYGGPMDGATAPSAGFDVGWFRRPWGSYVVGEPDGARLWFPADDHPTDKATYVVSVTVPAGLEVAATGLLGGIEDLADGRRRWTYQAADPTASYLVSVVVGDLDLTEPVSVGDVVIRHALAPGAGGGAAIGRTAEMMDFLAGWFGPYPFEAYGVVVVPEELGFGLENQTLTLLGSDLVSDTPATELLLVHELAHQWAGNDVSVQRWSDIWLNEGFATYAEWLWSEHIGAATTDRLAEDKRTEAVAAGFPAPLDPGPTDLFAPSVYGRGALVLDALRRQVGDEVFADFVRTWFGRFGGGSASTADFLDLARELGGPSAAQVARRWLTAEQVPDRS